MQQAREATTSKRRNSNSCRRDGKCAAGALDEAWSVWGNAWHRADAQ